MLPKLDRHPFPVEAFLEKTLVLGFAVPKAQLEELVPECLELDLFAKEWAFVAVAMVRTKHLRPKGLPRIFGRDFTLIGYRTFVRYKRADGRALRGLYILRSETDSASMKRLGGIFTQYCYEVIEIDWKHSGGTQTVTSSEGMNVIASSGNTEIPLPENSPFPDWKKARQFAGPMPFTFSYDKPNGEVIIVEGVRSAWTPSPVSVGQCSVPFLDQLDLEGIVLANAFIVENVPYRWKRGKVEKWNP